jgi:hypothetical protein
MLTSLTLLNHVSVDTEVQKIGIDGLKRVQFNGQSAWAETSSSMVSTQTTSGRDRRRSHLFVSSVAMCRM